MFSNNVQKTMLRKLGIRSPWIRNDR